MGKTDFTRAATGGLIATYAMMVTGFWQAGAPFPTVPGWTGLPKIDLGGMLAQNMNQHWAIGMLVLFLNGIILALIYARWFWTLLPYPGLVKGLLYGILTWFVASTFISPLVFPWGFWFRHTPDPLAFILGSFTVHAVYGLALGLSYNPERPVLSKADFTRAVVAGFIATYVMTMAGNWEVGVGLPEMDLGELLALNMAQSWVWGEIAHFLSGILLALLYACWPYTLLPGPGAIKGLIYGLILAGVAGMIISPLAFPAGFMFLKTPNPPIFILAGMMLHALYGITLGLIYEPARRA